MFASIIPIDLFSKSNLFRNVVGVLVDPVSGEIATENTKNKTLFYYIKGTQPNASENNLEEAISAMKEQ